LSKAGIKRKRVNNLNTKVSKENRHEAIDLEIRVSKEIMKIYAYAKDLYCECMSMSCRLVRS